MPTSLNKYLDPTSLYETVLNIRQIAEGLEEEIQDLPYARPDGLYPDMTVGAVIGADETAQWAQRESTGTGTAIVRSVQGAAVAWNQMLPELTRDNFTLAPTMQASFADGVATCNVNAIYASIFRNGVSFVGGHKYLQIAEINSPSGYVVGLKYQLNNSITSFGALTNGINEFERVAGIFTPSASSNEGEVNRAVIQVDQQTGFTFQVKNWQLFDLTQLFGTGNEPTTIEEFEAMYPEPYYPYSAPTLKPVTIAGFSSTDAQGGELDAIEWTAQTLRAAGSVADVLYSDHVDVRVGVVDLGTLDWSYYGEGGYFRTVPYGWLRKYDQTSADIQVAGYPSVIRVTGLDKGAAISDFRRFIIKDTSFGGDVDAFKAAMSGVLCFYPVAEPTTTPISPALPMTYKVQAGGSESIIVPAGEVSAAPVLTVAEPVNAGDEFARIWAAIESLGYTRNTAQLSRPVSLTDIGSIDEVQDDTTEIDTIKEVKE